MQIYMEQGPLQSKHADLDNVRNPNSKYAYRLTQRQVFSWPSRYARITQHMNRQHFLFHLRTQSNNKQDNFFT